MAPDSDTLPIERSELNVMRLKQGGVGTDTLIAELSPDDGPLLLDSYAVRSADLRALHDAGFCVAMFDDAKRLDDYACDMVVDSAPEAPALAYRGLADSRLCLGSDYVPLRDEFITSSPRTETSAIVRRIAVTFGGSDHDDLSARALEALIGADSRWQIDIILGPAYCGRAETLAANDNAVTIHRNVTDMAALLSQADMAVASSGGTALELAYLGVPMVLLGLSNDQIPVAKALADAGAADYLGFWDTVDGADIKKSTLALSEDVRRRASMNRQGKMLVDGGGAKRIAEEILNIWQDHPIVTKSELTGKSTVT